MEEGSSNSPETETEVFHTLKISKIYPLIWLTELDVTLTVFVHITFDKGEWS